MCIKEKDEIRLNNDEHTKEKRERKERSERGNTKGKQIQEVINKNIQEKHKLTR